MRDEAGALENSNRDSHARTAHSQHLRKKFLRQWNLIGANAIVRHQQPLGVANTRNGGGNRTPQADRDNDVRILDIYRNAASVRIDASNWIDYLQVAKWRGRWVIVNVLWDLKPKS
ncbi:MAG: nuclear transport factor 2 family protein [Gemmatimonadaceae bacterium]